MLQQEYILPKKENVCLLESIILLQHQESVDVSVPQHNFSRSCNTTALMNDAHDP